MEEKGETVPGAEVHSTKEASRRVLTRKKLGIIVAVVVIGVALVIGLWGMVPPEYLSVSDVLGNVDGHMNKSIEVKGLVNDWNSTAHVFNLTDGENDLTVRYANLPEGFSNGKNVVVRGILREDDAPFLESDEIVVGCPSKY